ncbi:aminopeptidase w07g4.4 [Plakobranchus ocellatus]|uniref:Aminopeptidase w07g4.4 n=1 Tax=Plakobranchus ocellatus TaxID=259542 RepID=A0AAV4CRJ4_9GAST|nr:aminopeptidase w07g4.4 [Plakobranchus ocellatus]
MAIATLTGHAASMVGRHYTVILDNGPAMAQNIAQSMQAAGEEYGEPLEISRIRREDYKNHKGESQYDDIRQTGSSSSRGHQGPAAFLIMASGLDQHGKNSSQPLPYTHLDIAGSAKMPLKYTSPGVPVIALSGHFVLNQKIVD